MAETKSGEEKVREFKEYLDAHPEIWAQIEEAKAADARGEGVPFRQVYEEAKRRDEEERRRNTKPSS